MKNRFLSLSLIASSLLWTACATHEPAPMQMATMSLQRPIIILHTNDVHAGIDDNIGYAGLAAYKNEMEARYGEDNVILVDAGDAVQGASVAMLTQGEAIIKLMNAVDYDYFVLGNHEFDYQIPRMFELTDMLEAEVVSSNFMDLRDKESVFSGYEIHTINGIDIAFVGVTTPESLTKASVQYFQDGKGNFIYGFEEDKSGEKLYKNVQKSIDMALADGAEYVVGLVHMGIDPVSKPWRSTDLIANTVGFDVVLDGHSHSVIEGEIHKDKVGNEVILSQTGTKLNAIGQVTIDPSKSDKEDIEAVLVGQNGSYTKKDAEVQALVDTINEEFKTILEKNVAYTEFELLMGKGNLPLARMGETNLGDLITDAYREILDTDVAIINGGGIRANVDKGNITFNEIINLHPFSNNIISVEVTGKTLKNALEMGAKSYPTADAGFMHVSGMTYEIDPKIPSSVKLNDRGNFIGVEGEYRVKNIMIDGKPLDEQKLYTLAGLDYILKRNGDGMAMFKDATILKDMFMVDSELLIKYIIENLNGNISPKYANPKGEGRINIL